jgi:hypothetical protein
MKNLKKIIIPVVLSAILLPFSQCTLLEQDIDGELSAIIPVDETDQDKNIHYSNSMILSANSDKDIKDNLDKIKDWSVKQISYSIMGYKGDPSTSFSGSVGFSKRGADVPSITASVSNLIFDNVSDNRQKYKVNLSEADLAGIAKILDADQEIKVYWKGTLSQGPVNCSVKVYAKVKIKAKLF